MSTLDWTIDEPGVWELDATYKHGSYTVPWQDVFASAIGDGFASVGERYGLPFERLHVRFVNGRQYGRMAIVGVPPPRPGRAERPPPPPFVLRLLTRLHPALRRRSSTARRVLAERTWRRDVERWHSEIRPRRIAANLRVHDEIDAAHDAPSIAVALHAASTNAREGTVQHFSLLGTVLPIGRLLATAGPSALALLANDSPATREARDQLDAIRRLVGEAAPERSLDSFSSLEQMVLLSPAVADAMAAYLRTYGSRLLGTNDVDGSTVGERPDLLVRAIQSAGTAAPITSGQSDSDRFGPPAEMLADARASYGVREDDVGIDMAWPAGLLRRALLKAGAHLVAEGVVDTSDDLFELHLDEIVDALTRPDGTTRVRDLVTERRQRRCAADAVEPPALIGGARTPRPPADAFPPAIAELMTAFGAYLSLLHAPAIGVGVGTKPYEGTARVSADPMRALDEVEPGDVLVTSITTPAFAAVLSMVGAVVTERGGLLSHPAIAARELQIPAVVGLAGATRNIPNGSRVRVDPLAGTVTVLDSSFAGAV
jgi:phosphohistidine swiveling domain-containing protein